MKKKIILILGSVAFLFPVYYYWQNRYVELRPVVPREDLSRPIFFSEIFHNQLFKIADSNEVPRYYYKNIEYVLKRQSQEYIVKNGVIYIKYKYMNDMEMIWNHTTKASNLEWFISQRDMDSMNGDVKKKEELYRIIKGFQN